MKYLTFFLIAGFLNCIASYDWNSEIENIGLLQALLLEFVSASASHWLCPYTVQRKLENEHAKAVECIKSVRFNSSFCDTIVNHFTPCVQGISKETRKCQDPEENAMTHMIVDSIIEEMRYICYSDGDHIFELFHPCVLNSVQMSSQCRRNVTEPLLTSITTTSICSAFPGTQKCFEDQMKHVCGNQLTRTTLHDFFSVNVKPCNFMMEMYFEIMALVKFN